MRDPYLKLKEACRKAGVDEADLVNVEAQTRKYIDEEYARAFAAEDPTPESITDYMFAPTPVT